MPAKAAVVRHAGPANAWVADRRSPGPESFCARAAQRASARLGLPPGLLAAIGVVESGRSGPDGLRVAWPYAVDADGAGHWFASEAQAASFIRMSLAGGARAIDVGCFQIDLEQHPDAFVTLRQAFDPRANAAYAARFLTRLRLRYGSWQAAVAAYHSATPSLGMPYARLVTAAWSGAVVPDPAVPDPHVIRMVVPRLRLPTIVTP